MTTKINYINSFRNKVIQKVIDQGLEVSNVARQFGISNALLNSWIDDSFNTLDGGNRAMQKVRKLQKDNWELKRQNDLLKKVIDHLNEVYTTR